MDGADDGVGKLFTGAINDGRLWMMGENMVADSLHEMSFADTDAAVEKERIIADAGIVGD